MIVPKLHFHFAFSWAERMRFYAIFNLHFNHKDVMSSVSFHTCETFTKVIINLDFFRVHLQKTFHSKVIYFGYKLTVIAYFVGMLYPIPCSVIVDASFFLT